MKICETNRIRIIVGVKTVDNKKGFIECGVRVKESFEKNMMRSRLKRAGHVVEREIKT